MEMTLITIQGSLIILLLGVVGFFGKSLVATLEDLRKAITDLTMVVERERTKLIQFEKSLEKHEKQIASHEKDITILKAHNGILERSAS